jgi:putative ABC transport system permease protein
MILFAKLLRESALFAWGSIIANKLRTILTLLGITIGIFAIISVFSVVDALEREIRSSIASLGDNVVYVQKWPWEFSQDFAWWKYMNRPTPRISEMEEIMKRTSVVDAAVFTANTNRTVEYRNRSMERVNMTAVSLGFDKIRSFEIESGRYFSFSESSGGRNVVVLGKEIADNLFFDTEPVGKTIKVFGRNMMVIGVFERQGEDTFGNSLDESAVIPVNFMNSFMNVNSDRYGPTIQIKGKEIFSNDEVIDELTGVMRSIRSIKPTEENDFALNRASLLSTQFDGLFTILKIAGWIIGGFSILVGGFGIANIMFVSVKERTSIIGIQKALGAKNYFILLQFLVESVILSLIGGIIGLFLVFLITWAGSQTMDMNLLISLQNVMLGVNVSVIIGLIAGFLPAYSASQLNPVDAIRANA